MLTFDLCIVFHLSIGLVFTNKHQYQFESLLQTGFRTECRSTRKGDKGHLRMLAGGASQYLFVRTSIVRCYSNQAFTAAVFLTAMYVHRA